MKRKERLTLIVFVMLMSLISLTTIATLIALRTPEPQQNITFPSFTYKYELSRQFLSERDDNITITLVNDGDVPLNISVWLDLPPAYSSKNCEKYSRMEAALPVGENITINCNVRPDPRTIGTYQAIINMEEIAQGLQRQQTVSLPTCYGEDIGMGRKELRC